MANESNMAIGVMQIGALNASTKICTFRQAYAKIPTYVRLSRHNLEQSVTRPREPMWHQLVRNIRSHHDSHKNFIAKGLLIHIPRVGYRVTPKGEKFLANK